MRNTGSAVVILLIVVMVIAAAIALVARAHRQASVAPLQSAGEQSRSSSQSRSRSQAQGAQDHSRELVADVHSDVLAELGDADRDHMERVILALAQRFTDCSVRGEPLPAVEDVISASGAPDAVSSILSRRSAGVFITVIRNNAVRACVGSIWPHLPSLAQEIAHFAAAAAARDLRRSPIEPWELAKCVYAVSVVGRLERVPPGMSWDPRSYGVFVRAGERSGVILPGEALTHAKQVSWALSEAGIDARMPYEMYRFQTAKFGGSLNLRGGLGQ